MYKQNGFTLLEALIGLGILALLAGLGLFLSMDFYRGYAFNYEKNLTVNLLQKARSQAMANVNQTKHGFYFDDSSHEYVLFQGDDYNDPTRDTSKDEVFPASRIITLGSMPAEGVVFEQLSGNLVGSSTTLKFLSDSRTSNIQINEEGRIDY